MTKTKDVLSTHDVALLCNVHLTTVINWVNDGALSAYTTPGGHRRIKKDDLILFMKEYKIPLPADIQSQKKRVLVVDDDLEALEEFKDALGGNDYDLDFALNGFEAGRKIYQKKPDLILLDFKMPGMDGFQVCELLKKDEDTRYIDVIAVTALNTDEDVKRIKECGVAAYLPKPVDIEALRQEIGNLLEI